MAEPSIGITSEEYPNPVSLENLSVSDGLPDLAVFQEGVLENNLLSITGMDKKLWQSARVELESTALVTVESIPDAASPFLHFHPILLPWLARLLAEDRRQELEAQYRKHYCGLAKFLFKNESRTPDLIRSIIAREIPNMKYALYLCIRAGESERIMELGICLERFLEDLGRLQERDGIVKNLEKLNSRKEKLSNAEFLMQIRKGEALLQEGRAADAEKVFQRLLESFEAGADYDGEYDYGMALVGSGRCLTAQGLHTRAIERHRDAIDVFEGLSGKRSDAERMVGYSHADLADNLKDIGQLDEAKMHYETSLDVIRENDEQRGISVVLGRLGTIAMMQDDLKGAAEKISEALRICQRLDDPPQEAAYWYELGTVHEKSENWDDADQCYHEAMFIYERIGDLPKLAQSLQQLADVTEESGRLDDAEKWYLKALELDETLSDSAGISFCCNNLACICLEQDRLDEAETYALRARKINEELETSTETWKPFEILAQIADKKGDSKKVDTWRQKSEKSQDEFSEGVKPQVSKLLKDFKLVIEAVVAACVGNEGAKRTVDKSFERFRKGGWRIEDAIRAIWAGERNEMVLARDIDLGSRAIVLAILSLLKGQNPFEDIDTEESVGAEQETEEWPEEEREISLTDLIEMAVLASGSGAPPEIKEQMMQIVHHMAGEPVPEVNALGQVLKAILSGDKNPDLSSLPDEMAAVVREVLGES
ncbi:tetratricopeptide repeat protein [Desulfobacterales bacterium HSG16]|nr:tetratricopeptide repeat protein [Desulfobacterales bacterium HSG16]